MKIGNLVNTMDPDRTSDRDRLTRQVAMLSIGGISLFLIGVGVLHVVARDLNPARHMVSEYALGTYGWIQTIDFLAVGVGAIALGIVLSRTIRGPLRTGPILVTGFGLSTLIVAFVKADGDGPTTTHGTIHTLISILGFAFLIAGMFVLARRFGHDPAWHSMRTPTQIWAWAAIATFFLVPILGETGQGIGQRIFIVTTFSWMIVAGVRALIIAQ